jgi:cysteine sulfinate desulfinase/cysteine desulfurase-like protein
LVIIDEAHQAIAHQYSASEAEFTVLEEIELLTTDIRGYASQIKARGYIENPQQAIEELQHKQQAQIDLEYLEKVCSSGASLLCVMAANNEVGTIYPVEKIGAIASSHNIPFLCDASQAVGKIPLNFHDWGITYLAISGHKLYAPKGVGALVVRQGYHLQPIIYGGGHQQGIRSGTLNVPGIVGLGEACELRQLDMEVDEGAIAGVELIF